MPLRNKEIGGIVLQESTNSVDKVKSIIRSLDIVLSEQELDYIYSFSYNTFNSINNTVASILRPLEYLSNRDVNKISYKPLKTHVKKQQTGKPDLFLEKDTLLRIKYIIRTLLDSSNQSGQTLILLPEKKPLKAIHRALQEEFGELMSIHKYAGANTKESRQAVIDLLTLPTEEDPTPDLPNKQVIISTRAGIFLPFYNLEQIILVDESNNFYIQDQNSLYYDTREAAYLLAHHYGAQVSYVSHLPSVRLSDSYSKPFLEHLEYKESPNDKKLPKIKIYERDNRDTFHNLISNEIINKIAETD